MKKIILSETRVDFKYKNIFGRNSDLQVIDGGFIELLKILVKKNLIITFVILNTEVIF